MSDLTIIRGAESWHAHDGRHLHVRLLADRATLGKRRWRGTAEDGRECGFDLEEPLGHGAHFFAEGGKHYVLEQTREEVLEIPATTAEQAARVAWNLGNLHFGVQVLPEAVRVTGDAAVLQFLSREHLAFQKVNCVFLPLRAGGHHHHEHHHG